PISPAMLEPNEHMPFIASALLGLALIGRRISRQRLMPWLLAGMGLFIAGLLGFGRIHVHRLDRPGASARGVLRCAEPVQPGGGAGAGDGGVCPGASVAGGGLLPAGVVGDTGWSVLLAGYPQRVIVPVLASSRARPPPRAHHRSCHRCYRCRSGRASES